MSNFEKELMILLKNKYIDVDDLKNFIDKSVNDQVNGNVNQMEFIRLLPVIIKNTNEFNFSWLSQIKEYSSIPGFLDTFINNIFLISYEEYQFLFLCILDEFKYIPIQKNHIRLLFQNILNYRVKVNYDSIYDMVNDIYPDMIPEMLLFFINHDYSCDDILSLFTKNNGKFLFLLYENIDIVLEHVHIDKLFYLKELVKDNESIYNYVISAIKLNSKKNVINLIKTLYLRVVVTHNYYHNLNYINEESFQNILEIIYLIIDDICKNEMVDISSIENIGTGSYSSVLLIGSKVIKIGLSRITPTFPNNPYVNAMLLRKEFPINERESIFVEVNEKVDSKDNISDEELYQLYKKLRDIHLIWLDVAKRNVGRLLKDNQASWRFPLRLTDEILGLQSFRGNETLKKGDVVILDNDVIYDEEIFFKNQYSSTNLQKEFEKRYLLEKKP